MKNFLFLALACLSACSWFHPRNRALPDSPELIVTGAPAGSTVFIDGTQTGEMSETGGKPQVLRVTSGEHIVEVRTETSVIFREQTSVGPGEKRLVKVLSGTGRE